MGFVIPLTLLNIRDVLLWTVAFNVLTWLAVGFVSCIRKATVSAIVCMFMTAVLILITLLADYLSIAVTQANAWTIAVLGVSIIITIIIAIVFKKHANKKARKHAKKENTAK